MFICNNADNNGVLRVRFLKLNVYSSSKACPLAVMQRVARVTMQSKERWIVRWSMLWHSVTIASRSCLKLLGCSSLIAITYIEKNFKVLISKFFYFE